MTTVQCYSKIQKEQSKFVSERVIYWALGEKLFRLLPLDNSRLKIAGLLYLKLKHIKEKKFFSNLPLNFKIEQQVSGAQQKQDGWMDESKNLCFFSFCIFDISV